MSREQNYTGIVLKKQPLGEADEIVTIYTQELGKLRVLAKSSKLAKSKLQAQLQPIFLINITVAGRGSLPKVISAVSQKIYKNIQNDIRATQAWYVVCELVLRSSADEQKNDLVYQTLTDFLDCLNSDEISNLAISRALVKFKINIAEALGFGILPPENIDSSKFYFSNSRGGFVLDNNSFDTVSLSKQLVQSFLLISHTPFNELATIDAEIIELQPILTSFISYQLERDLKSEAFMSS